MLLNSILLEGTLKTQPVYTPAPSEDSFDRCSFTLDCGPSAPAIPVIANHGLAQRCRELLDEGSSIRVVGRIIHDTVASESSGSFILAILSEHIEVKPSASHRHAEVA